MKKETKKNHILQRPEYPGGRKALLQTIQQNLRYPEPAREAGVRGTVRLRYGINYKGEVVDVKVVKGLGHGCDEEAIRVVKLLKFSIKRMRGMKILFHRTIQIHFHPPAETAPPSDAKQHLAQGMTIQYQYTPTTPPAGQGSKGTSIHYHISIKPD